MNASTRIRRLREAAGLTQVELAQRAGTTQPALSAYESGVRNPSEDTMRRITEGAGVRPSTLLERNHHEVVRAVKRNRGSAVWVFGSVARGTDTPLSDLDFVVRMTPSASLLDLVRMQEELEDLLGVPVDIVSEDGLRSNRHAEIIEEARAF